LCPAAGHIATAQAEIESIAPFLSFFNSLNPTVLLDDSLVGFERNTPHFEQLLCTYHQRLRSTTDTKHGSLRGSSVPIYFVCVVHFLFAWFFFCLRGFFFYLRGFFFVCVFSFLFAA